MFRPLRMDHTNCLQVSIKTLQLAKLQNLQWLRVEETCTTSVCVLYPTDKTPSWRLRERSWVEKLRRREEEVTDSCDSKSSFWKHVCLQCVTGTKVKVSRKCYRPNRQRSVPDVHEVNQLLHRLTVIDDTLIDSFSICNRWVTKVTCINRVHFLSISTVHSMCVWVVCVVFVHVMSYFFLRLSGTDWVFILALHRFFKVSGDSDQVRRKMISGLRFLKIWY